jgi:hypothetical protein
LTKHLQNLVKVVGEDGVRFTVNLRNAVTSEQILNAIISKCYHTADVSQYGVFVAATTGGTLTKQNNV